MKFRDKCVTFIAFVYIPWWRWFLYYNNIGDVIVNGVNLLKELLVFQMFGHVENIWGICGVLYSLYLVDWLILKGK